MSDVKKFDQYINENTSDENTKKLKGQSVSVYRDADGNDTTGGGITSKLDRIILVGGEVEGIFEVKEGEPYLELKYKRGYKYAVPRNIKETGAGPMFGGNFIYSSDSRFPNKYPIPVHDRYE